MTEPVNSLFSPEGPIGWLIQLDYSLFRLINDSISHPALDWYFSTITDFGLFQIPLMVAAIAAMIFGGKRFAWAIVLLGISVGLADLIGQDFKLTFDRLRPYWVLENVNLPAGGGNSRSPSFPSNHSANSFAAATILCWFFWRKLYIAIPIALIAFSVALSRIYVGVHFPLDTFFGASIGAGCASTVLYCNDRLPALSFSKEGKTTFSYRGLGVLLLILLFVYRSSVMIREDYGLAPFEATYITSLGFITSPFLTLFAKLSHQAGVESLFLYRLPGNLCSLFLLIILYRLMERKTKSESLAFFCTASLVIMPFFLKISMSLNAVIFGLCGLILLYADFEGEVDEERENYRSLFLKSLPQIILAPLFFLPALVYFRVTRRMKRVVDQVHSEMTLKVMDLSPYAISFLVPFMGYIFGAEWYDYRMFLLYHPLIIFLIVWRVICLRPEDADLRLKNLRLSITITSSMILFAVTALVVGLVPVKWGVFALLSLLLFHIPVVLAPTVLKDIQKRFSGRISRKLQAASVTILAIACFAVIPVTHERSTWESYMKSLDPERDGSMAEWDVLSPLVGKRQLIKALQDYRDEQEVTGTFFVLTRNPELVRYIYFAFPELPVDHIKVTEEQKDSGRRYEIALVDTEEWSDELTALFSGIEGWAESEPVEAELKFRRFPYYTLKLSVYRRIDSSRM